MNKKVLYKTYLHFNNVFGWIWLVLVSCFCIFLIVTFLFSPTIHNAKFYDLYHFIGYIFGQLFMINIFYYVIRSTSKEIKECDKNKKKEIDELEHA